MTPRKVALLLGTAVILATNGIALTGVAYNRSGEPESVLALSQRELRHSWTGRRNKENSGLALTLHWRVPRPEADTDPVYYGGYGGSPSWLDEARMKALGFDVGRAKANDARSARYMRHTEREVFAVFELAGEAWQHAIERARRRLAEQQSLRQANPDTRQYVEAEKQARAELDRETSTYSRLFAVDAGTDLAALRAKYPDRRRYLILKSTVRLQTVFRDRKPLVAGYLGKLAVADINVPHALRDAFEHMPSNARGATERQSHFTATVAIGRRLEPWIETVTTP